MNLSSKYASFGKDVVEALEGPYTSLKDIRHIAALHGLIDDDVPQESWGVIFDNGKPLGVARWGENYDDQLDGHFSSESNALKAFKRLSSEYWNWHQSVAD